MAVNAMAPQDMQAVTPHKFCCQSRDLVEEGVLGGWPLCSLGVGDFCK